MLLPKVKLFCHRPIVYPPTHTHVLIGSASVVVSEPSAPEVPFVVMVNPWFKSCELSALRC